jgi:SAM-dependent methyltransferase
MAAQLPAHLRLVRWLLRRLNYHFSKAYAAPPEPFDAARLKQAEQALRDMPVPPEAKAYLEKHLSRLARTLALVPPPPSSSESGGRVLELGCYMQITPFLNRLCGYKEVRGAYYGPVGRIDRKTMQFPDGEFVCEIDHFDCDRDPFPYPDEHFDLVIAGEIIEHLALDPMHMMLEARRVLRDGGHLIITTPNVGSITSAAKALDGRDNPQIFYLYKRPDGQGEIGHVREYTAHELRNTVASAGFEVQQLFTTFIEEFEPHWPLLNLLAAHGFDTENRGEQSWCLAAKRSDLPVDRFPYFLYTL